MRVRLRITRIYEVDAHKTRICAHACAHMLISSSVKAITGLHHQKAFNRTRWAKGPEGPDTLYRNRPQPIAVLRTFIG